MSLCRPCPPLRLAFSMACFCKERPAVRARGQARTRVNFGVVRHTISAGLRPCVDFLAREMQVTLHPPTWYVPCREPASPACILTTSATDCAYTTCLIWARVMQQTPVSLDNAPPRATRCASTTWAAALYALWRSGRRRCPPRTCSHAIVRDAVQSCCWRRAARRRSGRRSRSRWVYGGITPPDKLMGEGACLPNRSVLPHR